MQSFVNVTLNALKKHQYGFEIKYFHSPIIANIGLSTKLDAQVYNLASDLNPTLYHESERLLRNTSRIFRNRENRRSPIVAKR